MAGQIAIFEGYRSPPGGKKMPRKRKSGGSQRSKFAAAARKCGRLVRRFRSRGRSKAQSFRACMKYHLKKGGGRRRRSRR